MFTDKDYLLMAYEEATKSPDLSTQNGALLLSAQPPHAFVMAHNTLPDGVQVLPERLERPLKYEYTEHAERNVVYQAAKLGIPTLGATMYVPWWACSDCARAIIQAGVKRVVGHQDMFDGTPERWKESIATAMIMLKEAGIEMDLIKGKLNGPVIRFNGNPWQS